MNKMSFNYKQLQYNIQLMNCQFHNAQYRNFKLNPPSNEYANNKQLLLNKKQQTFKTNKKQDHFHINDFNNATNIQLKNMVQKLINKSKLLIQSLQETLKELDIVKVQKDYWKKQYFEFKQTCEQYIKSQSILQLFPSMSYLNKSTSIIQQLRPESKSIITFTKQKNRQTTHEKDYQLSNTNISVPDKSNTHNRSNNKQSGNNKSGHTQLNRSIESKQQHFRKIKFERTFDPINITPNKQVRKDSIVFRQPIVYKQPIVYRQPIVCKQPIVRKDTIVCRQQIARKDTIVAKKIILTQSKS